MCLEALEQTRHLEARKQTREGENRTLREEMSRLWHRLQALEADHAGMIVAFNDMAGRVAQLIERVLQNSRSGGVRK